MQPHLFVLKHDYMFRSAKTIIKPPLQDFQNKAKCSEIIIIIIIPTVGYHMCRSSYYNVKLCRTVSKIWSVIAGGCEVQVLKLCIDNIKNAKYKYRLLKEAHTKVYTRIKELFP
jgi:hypothetical protein